MKRRFSSHVVTLTVLVFSFFVFTDLLTHIKSVISPSTKWTTWGMYYLCMFSYRLETILPFSIATSTAIFLPKLIKTNALIPLLNAGLSLKSIVRPLFVIACICSGILVINSQFIYPKAISQYHTILDSDFGREKIDTSTKQLGVILCKDGSRLFFAHHNPKSKAIKDLFWVRSPNCVFHIEKLLYFEDKAPEGYGIDVVERDKSGKMRKTASYLKSELSELTLTSQELKTAHADPKELSILQLAYLVPRFSGSISEKAIETTIALYQKILFPFLAILALLIPLPVCLRFERRVSQGLLIFLSLAALFTFLIVVQFFIVLTRAPLSLPTALLTVPWFLAFFIGWKRCSKLAL